MTSVRFLDIHVLQSVPPSNLNRDDAGSPKQALYGGSRRARVSSQAWKRATRRAFAEHMPAEQLSTRTKRIASLMAEHLVQEAGVTRPDADRLVAALLTPLGIKAAKKGKRADAGANDTAYLLFAGRQQVADLAGLVADRASELAAASDDELAAAVDPLKPQVLEILGHGHPMDVALFGRMVADVGMLRVDAACQVAHALSTHAVDIEFDYFTAVDDENEAGETGAGMIGTVEFNSATLYRFATVGLRQLQENLDGDTERTLEAVRLFTRGFVLSMPTGHQNTFGNRTVPSLVSLVLRDDQPVNLVSAFEDPVPATGGFTAESMRRLAAELGTTAELWGSAPVLVASTYSHPPDGPLPALGEPVDLATAIDRVEQHLRAAVGG